ncbi:MAG TPA: DUF2336 domain-containing protein [Pseudolabrys sp.]|nr:DUF2336 domain-containing protein [Pseudolabrys sp.]
MSQVVSQAVSQAVSQVISRPAATNSAARSLIDELNDALAQGDVKRRLRLILRITDLFAAGARGYSREQIALFDDVLHELAAEIEVKARAQLAHKLAAIENAPPRLVRSLAFDDAIAVAGPVLAHSPQLDDSDLLETASSKSQEHLMAIAQRLRLSEAVTDVLVERGDRRVVHKLVSNKGASFSLAGYGKLTVRAHGDRKLTLALGRRSDIPREYFLKLLESASASVRAKLVADNPKAADAIEAAVDGVATAMQREARAASQEHAVAAREAKRRFALRPVTEAAVHSGARAQEFDKTAVALARLGRFPLDLVERALTDQGEDMVLLFAKAAGCSWTTARELLSMCAANRKMTADDVTQCFERYKKLTVKTAQSIVRFHAQSAQQRETKVRNGGAAGDMSDEGAECGSAPVPAGAAPVACEPAA